MQQQPYNRQKSLQFIKEDGFSCKNIFFNNQTLVHGHKQLTTACKMAYLLIDEIKTHNPSCNTDGTTSKEFVDYIVMSHSKYFFDNSGIEQDFFRVHILQMLIMLKQSGVIKYINNQYHIEDFNKETLNGTLFDSFWNKCSWSQFFPSMPSIAAHMQNNRSTIKKIINCKQRTFFVDSIAIDYMVSTDLNYRNELMFFSFFDFSIIRWLSFFGYLTYKTDITSRICVSAARSL